MNHMPKSMRDPTIHALRHEIADARDPQIMRIVATVDAMMSRGRADQLVAPLRQRLVALRPPRPLRFARLLFHPMDPLIVPAAGWRFGQHALPRTAIAPIAEHVHQRMGAAAVAIEAAIAGHTDAESDLIAGLGSLLWSTAARVLGAAPVPGASDAPVSWSVTELGAPAYRPLAASVSALLGQAAALDALCAATANGLLPPSKEAIGAILHAVAASNRAALPMMITLLLARLPSAAALLPHAGPEAAAIHAAMDQAADLMLGQLVDDDGAEARIAAGSLTDAGATAKGIEALLRQLDAPDAKPSRREKLKAVRQRLDAGCKARFAAGLQSGLLEPLQRSGDATGPADILALESVARGLRVLEAEARGLGSGAVYDALLDKAAEAIKAEATRNQMSLADQSRLVEILAGPDAALKLLGLPR